MEELKKYILDNWMNTVRTTPEDSGNLIGLPYPYTVPCIDDSFQEMYYWDTYFTSVGLIASGLVGQAENNARNVAYLIDRYGFMPNGSRTFYLTRSQPPFFSKMVRDVYAANGDLGFLKDMYPRMCREHEFWQTRRMTPAGLNRYFGDPVDSERVMRRAADLSKRLGIDLPDTKEGQDGFADAMISFCESGWDCNSRYGLYPHLHCGVDLNSLLYGLECDLAFAAKELSLDGSGWETAARDRKKLMNDLMWDGEKGAFFGYDFANKRKASVVSADIFYPLFTGLATKEQAEKTVTLLPLLENEYGLACTEKRGDLLNVQWDYPHGWACLHYIAVKGLENYGYTEEARRIAEKYIAVADKNFMETGNLWEKYDTVTGGVSVTKEYKTPKMMGWSAGVYMFCLDFLGK